MKKTILIYSALVIALLILFKLSQYSLYAGDLKIEIALSIVAFAFLIVGFLMNRKQSVVVNKDSSLQAIDLNKINALRISNREYEVLGKVALGLSNKEIGQQLFLSESTVKTHVSSLLQKLNAKRRTQAVKNAKSLHIID